MWDLLNVRDEATGKGGDLLPRRKEVEGFKCP